MGTSLFAQIALRQSFDSLREIHARDREETSKLALPLVLIFPVVGSIEHLVRNDSSRNRFDEYSLGHAKIWDSHMNSSTVVLLRWMKAAETTLKEPVFHFVSSLQLLFFLLLLHKPRKERKDKKRKSQVQTSQTDYSSRMTKGQHFIQLK